MEDQASLCKVATSANSVHPASYLATSLANSHWLKDQVALASKGDPLVGSLQDRRRVAARCILSRVKKLLASQLHPTWAWCEICSSSKETKPICNELKSKSSTTHSSVSFRVSPGSIKRCTSERWNAIWQMSQQQWTPLRTRWWLPVLLTKGVHSQKLLSITILDSSDLTWPT